MSMAHGVRVQGWWCVEQSAWHQGMARHQRHRCYTTSQRTPLPSHG